ncbi:nnp-1 protein putative nuclear protein 1 nop52 [Anaeramoeba flamelloides]|uniref:Nnp-1 protein putative nuclear protein 1 nop52 n=1 Tax=Anaeramoeba flamelloides TaxID=1746091 RepID=A0ABQ8XQY3_9EUKA|nr:nnp-1 protein putative nuclear protein 1 nop52 [Anaeramoeba flamelloides]
MDSLFPNSTKGFLLEDLSLKLHQNPKQEDKERLYKYLKSTSNFEVSVALEYIKLLVEKQPNFFPRSEVVELLLKVLQKSNEATKEEIICTIFSLVFHQKFKWSENTTDPILQLFTKTPRSIALFLNFFEEQIQKQKQKQKNNQNKKQNQKQKQKQKQNNNQKQNQVLELSKFNSFPFILSWLSLQRTPTSPLRYGRSVFLFKLLKHYNYIPDLCLNISQCIPVLPSLNLVELINILKTIQPQYHISKNISLAQYILNLCCFLLNKPDYYNIESLLNLFLKIIDVHYFFKQYPIAILAFSILLINLPLSSKSGSLIILMILQIIEQEHIFNNRLFLSILYYPLFHFLLNKSSFNNENFIYDNISQIKLLNKISNLIFKIEKQLIKLNSKTKNKNEERKEIRCDESFIFLKLIEKFYLIFSDLTNKNILEFLATNDNSSSKKKNTNQKKNKTNLNINNTPNNNNWINKSITIFKIIFFSFNNNQEIKILNLNNFLTFAQKYNDESFTLINFLIQYLRIEQKSPLLLIKILNILPKMIPIKTSKHYNHCFRSIFALIKSFEKKHLLIPELILTSIDLLEKTDEISNWVKSIITKYLDFKNNDNTNQKLSIVQSFVKLAKSDNKNCQKLIISLIKNISNLIFNDQNPLIQTVALKSIKILCKNKILNFIQTINLINENLLNKILFHNKEEKINNNKYSILILEILNFYKLIFINNQLKILLNENNDIINQIIKKCLKNLLIFIKNKNKNIQLTSLKIINNYLNEKEIFPIFKLINFDIEKNCLFFYNIMNSSENLEIKKELSKLISNFIYFQQKTFLNNNNNIDVVGNVNKQNKDDDINIKKLKQQELSILKISNQLENLLHQNTNIQIRTGSAIGLLFGFQFNNSNDNIIISTGNINDNKNNYNQTIKNKNNYFQTIKNKKKKNDFIFNQILKDINQQNWWLQTLTYFGLPIYLKQYFKNLINFELHLLKIKKKKKNNNKDDNDNNNSNIQSNEEFDNEEFINDLKFKIFLRFCNNLIKNFYNKPNEMSNKIIILGSLIYSIYYSKNQVLDSKIQDKILNIYNWLIDFLQNFQCQNKLRASTYYSLVLISCTLINSDHNLITNLLDLILNEINENNKILSFNTKFTCLMSLGIIGNELSKNSNANTQNNKNFQIFYQKIFTFFSKNILINIENDNKKIVENNSGLYIGFSIIIKAMYYFKMKKELKNFYYYFKKEIIINREIFKNKIQMIYVFPDLIKYCYKLQIIDNLEIENIINSFIKTINIKNETINNEMINNEYLTNIRKEIISSLGKILAINNKIKKNNLDPNEKNLINSFFLIINDHNNNYSETIKIGCLKAIMNFLININFNQVKKRKLIIVNNYYNVFLNLLQNIIHNNKHQNQFLKYCLSILGIINCNLKNDSLNKNDQNNNYKSNNQNLQYSKQKFFSLLQNKMYSNERKVKEIEKLWITKIFLKIKKLKLKNSYQFFSQFNFNNISENFQSQLIKFAIKQREMNFLLPLINQKNYFNLSKTIQLLIINTITGLFLFLPSQTSKSFILLNFSNENKHLHLNWLNQVWLILSKNNNNNNNNNDTHYKVNQNYRIHKISNNILKFLSQQTVIFFLKLEDPKLFKIASKCLAEIPTRFTEKKIMSIQSIKGAIVRFELFKKNQKNWYLLDQIRKILIEQNKNEYSQKLIKKLSTMILNTKNNDNTNPNNNNFNINDKYDLFLDSIESIFLTKNVENGFQFIKSISKQFLIQNNFPLLLHFAQKLNQFDFQLHQLIGLMLFFDNFSNDSIFLSTLIKRIITFLQNDKFKNNHEQLSKLLDFIITYQGKITFSSDDLNFFIKFRSKKWKSFLNELEIK